MNTTIAYEWVIETVEIETNDVGEVDHRETFAKVRSIVEQCPPEEGYRFDIGLVRKRYAVDDPCNLLCVSYAYIDEDGILPSHFETDYGVETAKVPKRFHAEVEPWTAMWVVEGAS